MQVQDGKVLTAEHTYMSKPHKLEGLCVSINQTEDTVAVGCRDSKVIVRHRFCFVSCVH